MEYYILFTLAAIFVLAVASSGIFWRLRASRSKESVPFLCNREIKLARIIDISNISHDTKRLTLALESKHQPLGLPVGKHVLVYAPNVLGCEDGKWNGKPDQNSSLEEITRKYTPVSSASTIGKMELLIKIYNANPALGFADGGKMSRYIDSLNVGDDMKLSGPYGLIEYLGWGKFQISGVRKTAKKIGLLAGGTGITPIYQLVRAVLENHSDAVEMSLIYANKTEDDILLRDELEEYNNQYPDRFKLAYTLDNPPSGWTQLSGFITQDMIKAHIPGPSADTLIFCCGPPPMIEYACKKNLLAIGYSADTIHVF